MTNDNVTNNERVEQSADDIDRSDLLVEYEGAGALLAAEIGEEVWIPVSPVRGDAFRAVKVEVKERASVGGYEEKHAICNWENDAERLYGRSIDTRTDDAE